VKNRPTDFKQNVPNCLSILPIIHNIASMLRARNLMGKIRGAHLATRAPSMPSHLAPSPRWRASCLPPPTSHRRSGPATPRARECRCRAACLPRHAARARSCSSLAGLVDAEPLGAISSLDPHSTASAATHPQRPALVTPSKSYGAHTAARRREIAHARFLAFRSPGKIGGSSVPGIAPRGSAAHDLREP
jgi:hypothetical protein